MTMISIDPKSRTVCDACLLSSNGNYLLSWSDDLDSDCELAISLLRDTKLWSKIYSQVRSCVLAVPDTRDLFVRALSELRDTGDIDCLVRALNWQHNDIAFLSHELSQFESSLAKLDKLRVQVARLKDANNTLKQRNIELMNALRSSNLKVPRSNEKKTKAPRSRR